MSRRAVRFSLASPGRSADDDTDFGDVDTGTGDEIDLEDDAPGLRLDGHTTGRDHDRASDTDEQGRSVNEAPRVLCVQVKSGLIGCAFYELTTGKLSLLEDAPQDGRRVHTHQARPAEPEDDEEMADDLQAGEQKNEEADWEKAKETLMIREPRCQSVKWSPMADITFGGSAGPVRAGQSCPHQLGHVLTIPRCRAQRACPPRCGAEHPTQH